jgi:ABC-type transport system involved in cytochrome c biogenesis permease subunit
MKRKLSALAVLLAVIAVAFTLRAPRNPAAYDVTGFGVLPTLVNGRVKPLDTVARTSLLMMQGRQRLTAADGRNVTPEEWLLDMLFTPAVADHYAVFEIVHPDALAMLDLQTATGQGGKRFSLRQILPKIAELDRQAKLADNTEHALRSPFQRAVVQLRNNVALYQRLQHSLAMPGSPNFFDQLTRLETALPEGTAAARAARAGQGHGGPNAKPTLEMARLFAVMDAYGYLHTIPPPHGSPDGTDWKTAGASWNEALATGTIDPTVAAYAEIGRAWRMHQPEIFNREVRQLREKFEAAMPAVMQKTGIEVRFNVAQPFSTAMTLYVLAFLVGVVSWLRWPAVLTRTAFGLLALAFILTTAGIVARMWLEGRPPVTNLYSSALFVGWGAVALCVILEFVYRNAMGSVSAGLIGFATLVIAHHLALGGDTMEMMRAVLDSNFWLATHVITISVGYSATFLAGFLGLIYVGRGVLTRGLDAATSNSLGRMIYGIACFATLFSFVGTVLGGIWADQSWGRFWGWDPKENGALLIVMWNAVILHVRWGGLVQARGLALMAIFGNVITAWSWFGVNMLGVGLHSYGFMDSAFWWLIFFASSQMAFIAMGGIPIEKWRSAAALRPVRRPGPAATLELAGV